MGSRGIREDGPEYQDLGVMDTLPTFKNWEDSHFRGGGGALNIFMFNLLRNGVDTRHPKTC